MNRPGPTLRDVARTLVFCLVALASCSKKEASSSEAKPSPSASSKSTSKPAASKPSAASTEGWKHQAFRMRECTFAFDAPVTLKKTTKDDDVVPVTFDGGDLQVDFFSGQELDDAMPKSADDKEIYTGSKDEQLQSVESISSPDADFPIMGFGRERPSDARPLGCSFLCYARSAPAGLAFCKSIRITVDPAKAD